jgi:predicted dehydrogenase
MENTAIRLGIAGVGSMGSAHARSVLDGKAPGLVLTAIADIREEALRPLPDLRHFTDASEMIQSGEIDAILIATPHYSHTTIGIEALEAGLHVLVEKPISAHKEDCEKLIAAHNPGSAQVFAAMFNQRTDPRYRKLKQLIEEGTLGRINRINWVVTDWFRSEHYYRSGDWRATWAGEGGGVLLNQCPHNLDLWQWLFGMPSRVYAKCQIGRFHDIEVEDSVTAVLEYESGVQGVFCTTTGEAPGVNRLEVAGENGLITVDDNGLVFRRNEQPSAEYSATTSSRFDKPPVWEVFIPTEGKGERHVGILKNFAAAIQGRESLIAPAEEGIRSVELANAMLLSSFKAREISLPIDSGEYAAELKERISNSTHTKEAVEVAAEEDFSKSFGA